MHTVFTGNPPITQAILSTSSDRKHSVNFTIHKNDYTPLMMSCLTNNIELVRFLLQNGANTSAKSSIGKTAAELAAFTGHSEIAALLSNFYQNDKLSSEMKKLIAETNLAPSNIAKNYYLEKIDQEKLMDIFHKESWPLAGKCAYLYHIINDIKEASSVKKYIKLQSISSNIEGTKPFQHAA